MHVRNLWQFDIYYLQIKFECMDLKGRNYLIVFYKLFNLHLR